jgi:hypothetical protein
MNGQLCTVEKEDQYIKVLIDPHVARTVGLSVPLT